MAYVAITSIENKMDKYMINKKKCKCGKISHHSKEKLFIYLDLYCCKIAWLLMRRLYRLIYKQREEVIKFLT